LKVDPSTATRAVQRLEKLGLAQRKALVTDGRVVTVAVTQAGRDRHAIISERRMKAIVEILTDFTPAEQATLAELLDRFVVAIGNVARTFEP
jgi:DNA-binding MarR family transcriptional regulator